MVMTTMIRYDLFLFLFFKYSLVSVVRDLMAKIELQSFFFFPHNTEYFYFLHSHTSILRAGAGVIITLCGKPAAIASGFVYS